MEKFVVASEAKHYFDLFKLRYNVFIKEQNIDIELEMDEYDKDAIHYLYYLNNNLVSYCRVVLKEEGAKIGRYCVSKDFRKQGYGSKLFKHLEEDIIKNKKANKLILSSQLHAKNFYEKLGFQQIGAIFYEANIEHVSMSKQIN